MLAVILFYFRGFFLGLIPDNSKRSGPKSTTPILTEAVPSLENVGALSYTAPELLTLAPERWGKDIFYDRSNIYKNRFKLTGITRFENGYKAIINGDIALEGKRFEGFTVADITENRVLLKRNKHRVTLKLEK